MVLIGQDEWLPHPVREIKHYQRRPRVSSEPKGFQEGRMHISRVLVHQKAQHLVSRSSVSYSGTQETASRIVAASVISSRRVGGIRLVTRVRPSSKLRERAHLDLPKLVRILYS